MHPYLFTSEYVSVPTYGVLYLLAYLSTIFVIAHLGTRLGLPFWKMVDRVFMICIAGEAGARLTFLIVEWERVIAGAIPLKSFLLAGRVVLGGVIAAIGFAVWKFRHLPARALLDAVLVGISLGMGVGRLACLMAGCCFGKPTEMWWGITFTDPAAAAINNTPLGVALHPTQIIQSIDGFLLFGLLYWWFGRRKFDGQIVALYCVIEGTSRFLVEFLRGDSRGEVSGLATSQWIGIAMVIAGAVWLWRGRGGGLTPTRPL